MERKRSLPIMTLLVTIAWFVFSFTSILATTWYVAPASMGGDDNNPGTSPGDPWEHISFAVDQAAAGDTIKVMDDNDEATDDYIENIIIPNWRTNLVLERYDDIDPNPQIKAEDLTERVISVYGDSVTIRGFDIYGSTAVNDVGIYLHTSTEYCIIENNRCGYNDTRYNGDGIIVAEGSSRNIISGNIINYNHGEGILLEESSHSNTITDNVIHNNYGHGILIDHSDNNIISGNTFTDNSNYGIYPYFSNNNIITDNTSNNNVAGIYAFQMNNSVISGNECNDNGVVGVAGSGGIILNEGSYNTFSNNTCNNNNVGLVISGGSYNSVSENTCANNWFYSGFTVSSSSKYNSFCNNTSDGNPNGLAVFQSCDDNIVARNIFINNDYGISFEDNASINNNIFLNNFSNNTNGNVSSSNSGNIWQSPTEIHYSYSSLYKNFLGNYYSDYNGSDPDGDGIGNTPYILPGLEPDDDYPLIETQDQYLLQAWWLYSNSIMYGDNMTKPAGSVAIGGGGSNIWIANQTLQTDIVFAGGSGQTWKGQLVFTTAPANGHNFLIELGSWDGSNFTPGGPDVTLNGDGSATVFTYETDNMPFTVNTGDFLALRLTNNSGSSYDVQTGGGWSYTSSPEGSDNFPVAVEELSNGNIPAMFMLEQNYPNPFNPSTKIRFTISDLRFTILKVYDVLGNEVATLVSEELPAGEYEVEFKSRGLINQTLSSGVYFYQLRAGDLIQTKKMILLK